MMLPLHGDIGLFSQADMEFVYEGEMLRLI